MKEIEFDVTLRAGEIFAFTMRHTYRSISGIFGLIISFGCLLICLLQFRNFEMTTNMALLFVGLLFTVIQPLMLYVKCMLQVKRSKDINAPLHYVLSEDGIIIRQGEQEAVAKWYDIRKVIRARGGIYLYLSPVRAFIFPKEQCGSQYEEICAAVQEQVEKYKDYVPEENAENAETAEVHKP